MPCSHSTPDPASSRTSASCGPVIDAPLRSALDRVSSLVSRLLGASMVTFVLVDDAHYVTASTIGRGEGFADFPLPLAGSLCAHVVTSDERFVTNAVAASHTGATDRDFGCAYAGIELLGLHGEVLGAFCALDDGPRAWTISELAILSDFAGLVSDHLTFDDARR
ncbi:MAG: GAF domain-containing protein [Solirubrobacteraceae bacterium]|nr:GAF domain-containing protein [Patulibacter sp.]